MTVDRNNEPEGHLQSRQLAGLCLLAIGNAFVIIQCLHDRPTASIGLFIGLLIESVLALYLWGQDRENWKNVAFGVSAIATIIAIPALELALLSRKEAKDFGLFLAVLLTTVQALLFCIGLRALGKLIFGQRVKETRDEDLCKSCELSKFTGVVLLLSLLLFLGGMYFSAIYYRRSGILGWDTPNYAWRGRLVDQAGVLAHVAKYDNGLHVVFPSLVALIHRLTQWSYWDVVQFLSPLLALAGCLAVGLLVYSATHSWIAFVTSVTFAAGFFPVGRFVADLRDNLTSWVLGTMALALLSIAFAKKTWALRLEILGALCVVLAGFSHTAISAIFLVTIGIVYFVEFIEWWQSQRTSQPITVSRAFLGYMRIPLMCYVIFGLSILPVLSTYLASLRQFGLDTTLLGNTTQYDLRWLVEKLRVPSYWPWALIGVLAVVESAYFRNSLSRPHALIFALFLTCLSMYFLLPGRLPYRYFMMIPFPALVGIGVDRIYLVIKRYRYIQRLVGLTVLITLVFGLVLPFNLAAVYQDIISRKAWFTPAMLTQMSYVNEYIQTRQLRPPYVFLVERQKDGIAFSILWQNVIRATIAYDDVLNNYLYFGDLASFIERRPSTLPEMAVPSQFWWQMVEHKVLEQPHVNAFILQEFNPDMYDDYLYSPYVDLVAPGVLIVRRPVECAQEATQ